MTWLGHGTLTKLRHVSTMRSWPSAPSLPPSKPRRLPWYAIVRTSSYQRNQRCAIVRTSSYQRNQWCAIVRTVIKNVQSCGRAVINNTYKDEPSEGLPVINDTSTMTTWVKGCQLSTICMMTTWVKGRQLSTTRNRYSQFGDDLSEGSSSRSEPRSHGGGLRLERSNSTHNEELILED